MNAPDPAAHPIVLFDGVCNLCHGAVRFLLEHDEDARLRFAPLQSDLGRTLLTQHGLNADGLDTMVLVDADGAHLRSDAALRIVRELGPPWRWLRVLAALPRPLRDAAYDFVARNRYRWFGKKDACPMASAEWTSRFLA
jgi:predicted DCC family thiol-disulfide oxidoreductase YuxK